MKLYGPVPSIAWEEQQRSFKQTGFHNFIKGSLFCFNRNIIISAFVNIILCGATCGFAAVGNDEIMTGNVCFNG